MKTYNVLSLFDGMSCGRIALERAGISVGTYYASEIDATAIAVTKHNYPDTIHLGDVTGWKEWNIDWGSIDMVIGGSPCTGFSFAGKQLNFEDSRSKLFFVFVDILKRVREHNPDVLFLLENVRMKKEYQNTITQYMGVEPININSQLVSGALRNRFYWTNITGVEMPEDKGIVLQDILESGITDRKKARALLESDSRPLRDQEKMWRRYKTTGFSTVVFTDGNTTFTGNNLRYLHQKELERLQTVPEGYTSTVSRNKAASLLGNGWTVDVISHIFSFIKN